MSYPITSQDRLIVLFGFSQVELQKIKREENFNEARYQKRLENLDKEISNNILKQILSEDLFKH